MLAPWRVVGLPNTAIPLTRFEVVALEGERVLRVQVQASYGNLVHLWSGQARQLQWRWRLDQPLAHSALRTREGDDVALKLCVLFDMPTTRLPWAERAQLSLARAVSREALPAATLCYIADRSLPVGTVLPNAYTRRMRYLVVQSGEPVLRQWHSVQRELLADFSLAFQGEFDGLPPVSAVLVGGDADNTGGEALGYVGDVALLR